MFFHIDETGNTGLNLFDKNQTSLIYGILSSTLNVDTTGQIIHKKMLSKLNVDQLHATELGATELEKITDDLIERDLCTIIKRLSWIDFVFKL